MGWMRGWKSRKELVNELTRAYDSAVPLHWSSTNFGRHLWVAVENGRTGERFIMLYLMEKREGAWGYKPIAEEMGPLYYDCPVKLLDLVPEDAESSIGVNKEWREKVRKSHAQAGIKYKAGDVVDIHGQDYRLVGKYRTGRSWIIERVTDKKIFKSSPKPFHLKYSAPVTT